MIFDLHLYAIHDGPGIRTTVFFKGCPLRCAWCHNPESQSFEPELMLLTNRCNSCGACAQTCRYGAIKRVDYVWQTDRSVCTVCGKCSAVCYADGRQLVGDNYTLDEVKAKIDADAVFYANSGGGVTFSGGEPLAQLPVLLELLQYCKSKGYHTAVDTCGHAPWESFEQVLPFTNLVLYDLKMIDPMRHLHYTGVSNDLILRNLTRLANAATELWIRIPVIPGVNDDETNLSQTIAFLDRLPKKVRGFLLPYHNVASTKYANLGRTYSLGDLPSIDVEQMNNILAYFSDAGIQVQQGG